MRITCQVCGKPFTADWGESKTIKCPSCGCLLAAESVVGSDLKRRAEEIRQTVKADRAKMKAPVYQRDERKIICPNQNCGYAGEPKTIAKGSRLALYLLLLLVFPVGMLYLLFWSGYNYYCPKCGNKLEVNL